MKKFVKNILYNLKLNKKFLIVYVCCVIIPLIITDALVFNGVLDTEITNRRYDRENEAIAYENFIINAIEYDSIIARAASANRSLNQFVETNYEQPYDFYSSYSNFVSTSFFNTLSGLKSDKIVVYADNPTILNGGCFQQLSRAKDQEWYKRFVELDQNEAFLIFYDTGASVRKDEHRKVLYIKRLLDYSYESKMEKIIVIENDDNYLARSLYALPSENPMYVMCGDYCVFSNTGDDIDYYEAMEIINGVEDRNKTENSFFYRGTEIKIYILNDAMTITSVIAQRLWIFIGLLLFTIIFPILIMRIIERSITGRIFTLNKAFEGDKSGAFKPISTVTGSDEIASLMSNYNRIVDINNTLINTVYKEKLREQESDIARKNAELLALQSQINPHFLFNALESIRMHSMLKGEDETAEMVEKLAVMERQNVEWENDAVTIRKELEFIRAYLSLQNYRFGERLSFDIDIQNGCENILIPKLTLTTFVENACVHGIESKASQGWIFVRIYKTDELFIIEVEDTGDGMDEDEVEELTERINNVDIETIKNRKRVGILNACLRIKMMFEDKVRFVIDSEKGIGFSVSINIPIDMIKEQGEK